MPFRGRDSYADLLRARRSQANPHADPSGSYPRRISVSDANWGIPYQPLRTSPTQGGYQQQGQGPAYANRPPNAPLDANRDWFIPSGDVRQQAASSYPPPSPGLGMGVPNVETPGFPASNTNDPLLNLIALLLRNRNPGGFPG